MALAENMVEAQQNVQLEAPSDIVMVDSSAVNEVNIRMSNNLICCVPCLKYNHFYLKVQLEPPNK